MTWKKKKEVSIVILKVCDIMIDRNSN